MDSKNFQSNSAQSQNFLNINVPDNKLLDAKLILENEKMPASTVLFVNSTEPSITIIKNNLRDENINFLRYEKQYQRNYIYNLSIMISFIVLVIFAFSIIVSTKKFIIVMELMIFSCLLINLGLIAYNIMKKHFEIKRMNDIIRTNMYFGFMYFVYYVIVHLCKIYYYNLLINSN